MRLFSLACTVACCGCEGDGYRILVMFDPAGLADEVALVEVSVVAACPPADLVGEAPIGALRTVQIREGVSTPALGAVPAGSYALHAIGRDADCTIVAAGCTAVAVEAEGTGSFTIVARELAGAGCQVPERCVDATCVSDDEPQSCLPDPDSCTVAGSLCGSDDECCGCRCRTGRCEEAGSGCEVAGESCNVDTDCCSGACSSDDRCAPLTGCRPSGELCSGSDDCCTARCEDGRCEELSGCTVVGELCDVDYDCCSGACVSDSSAGSSVYRCTELGGCRPSGELCDAPGACCTAACDRGRCQELEGCVVAGELCDVDSDCCSDRCSSDASAGESVYRCE